MKVTFGILLSHGFPVPACFVVGSWDMARETMTGSGNRRLPSELQVDAAKAMFSHAFPTDVARNELCRLFLDEDNGDYLLFLDADMRHPGDVAHQLVRHGVDVVSGHYVTRRPPFWTVAMRKTGAGLTEYQSVDKLVAPPLSGLLPVDAAGAGVLLISRRCLLKMRAMLRDERMAQEPDFPYPHLAGDDWFRYQDGPDGLRSRSEDMWFFEKAKQAGFQPWLDADCKCTHRAEFEVDGRYNEPYREAYERAVAHGAAGDGGEPVKA